MIDDRRKSERRIMQLHVDLDRRLCERRQQIADEAGKSGIHCINQFRERQRGLNLGTVHLSGQIISDVKV